MIFRTRYFLFLLLIFTGMHGIAQTGIFPLLRLDADFEKSDSVIKLDSKIAYLIEGDTPLTADTLLHNPSRFLFKDHFEKESPDKLQGDYWIAFSLQNQTSGTIRLRLYFATDRLTLYTIDSNGSQTVMRGGMMTPYGEWPSMNSLPRIYEANNYPLELPPYSFRQYLARSEPYGISSSEFNGIFLFPEKKYLLEASEQFSADINKQMVFQGMMLILILFNLATFIINRDRSYLYYSLFVLSIAYYWLSAIGFDRWLIWGSHAPMVLPAYNASVYAIPVFYSLFALHFLHRQGWKPRLKKWMRYFTVFAILSAVISTLILTVMPVYSRVTAQFMQLAILPTGLWGGLLFIYANIVYVRSSNKPARYFGLGGMVLILGLLFNFTVSMLRVINVLPDLSESQLSNMSLIYFMETAMTFQVLIFALTLSYRSRMIEKEKTELEVMDTTKEKFFANISHEFKTPLTLILGPAAELGKKTTDSSVKNTVGIIERNARRLLGLINEILDLSKLDAGKLKPEFLREDIIEFVSKQTLMFSSFALNKKIDLRFSSGIDRLEMAFDPDKMQKILTNLLSNAFKFTPEGGTVTVQTEQVKKQNREYLSIRVTDTGTGIAPEHLPHLFERYYQANRKNYTTDQPSTGIGLALTRELIELHEGSIEVTSRLQQGTTVTVLLPVDLAASDGRSQPVSGGTEFNYPESPVPLSDTTLPEENNELPHLLLVEDNQELRAYIHSCIGDGYSVTEAADGEEGLLKAIESIPDLIITDVMMPRKDGFEVCRDIKQNEKTNHIPVIILTGKSSHASRLEGLQTEADAYIAKPFDADELRLQITNLLKNRDRMREHYSHKLFLETTQQEITSIEESFLQKAIQLVEENIADEHFSVDQLSKHLYMDRTQLFRKLKALTDQNPSNFIRNLRLKRARYMLENGAGTVSDIAFAVGFSSTTYFNKCFKELYGESPGKLKN